MTDDTDNIEDLPGFNRIGKPLDNAARALAYEHCKTMGLTSARAFACVNTVAEQLERDKPFEAMEAGRRHLDLTGTYRLLAVLLTAPKPKRVRSRKTLAASIAAKALQTAQEGPQ